MFEDCVPIPQFETQGTPDQRKTERFHCRRPVVMKSSDGWQFNAICTDVNASGIGIDTEHLLRVGQRVQLSLDDGKGNPISMLVLYRNGKHYGLAALGGVEELLALLPVQA